MERQKREPELQRLYHRLLQPLSLFPRKATPAASQKRRPEEIGMVQLLSQPRLTVASLCRQVAQRLARSGLTAPVRPEDRLRLTEVILDELKCGWQEPPAEPDLSQRDNQKLRQRLEAHVLLSSEQLFLRYLHLLVTMSAPASVFTEPATLTRLAANLAKDCTLFLTSPDVYRCLLADFRVLLKVQARRSMGHKYRAEDQESRAEDQHYPAEDQHYRSSPIGASKLCPMPWPHGTGFAHVPCSSLNLNYLVYLSRPPEFLSKPEPDPMKELKAIALLKKRKPFRWLPSMPKKRELEFSSSQIVSPPSNFEIPTKRATPTRHLPLSSQLRGHQSMPCLRDGWKLADELGFPLRPPRPLTPLVLVVEGKPELERDAVAEDLRQMVNVKLECVCYRWLSSGLPPLLGALTRYPAAGHRMEELQRTLKALQEEEAFGQRDRQPPKAPPLHPQPVTMTLKLRDQGVVQAAAVQVSDRNFLDSFHVEGAGVLYNHLTGELDPKLIEEMDSHCFVGSNIREVYKELMSRVSTDHFCFDQGPLVEPAADKDWSTFLSSAFLRQEKQYHIINPELADIHSRDTNALQPNPERPSSMASLYPRKSWERQSNKFTWMNWWQAGLSGDDYFKYLSSQETDFLHIIFQMYEEEVPVEIVAPVKESLEIHPPPLLLEDEEPWDFVPGEWDCNVVLEHRLGVERLDLLGEPHKLLSLQKRLEWLWSMLEVPDKDRLEMAIKYSSNARLGQLPSLVNAWECALQPIQLREILLGRLERFERHASDPNRFFQKTDTGLSCLLEENQIRNHLYRKLRQVEAFLVPLLEEIELIFEDPVTFKGRRYLDKMKCDKVEMLYWLQQGRRVHHLVQAQKTSRLSALSKRLSSQPLVAPGNTPITL
ncbi:coiled-coil domain-containing protein 87 [Choloepus didactylus]|uniref:coiled-coil domain-containing protein 87 n=1 Tax=Choloepus didactylus TaxID=27675 RepID=UPI00189CF8C2|nr:coiled-coil domain-containing protein 87 [Choloepus didactylus]